LLLNSGGAQAGRSAMTPPICGADARISTLHEPRYSMVSYAWGRDYQQSNQ
jgi:hypothetical protein